MGDRVVGYAAEEWRRITVLLTSVSNFSRTRQRVLTFDM